MHKLSTRLLSLLLSVMLIVSMSFVAYAAEEDEFRPYGDQTLETYTFTSLYSGDIYHDELSPTAQIIYDGLKTAMTDPKDSWRKVVFPSSSIKPADLKKETFVKAYSALRYEWPELFQWAGLGFSFILEVTPDGRTLRLNYFLDVQDEYCGTENTCKILDENNNVIDTIPYWDIKPTTVSAQQKEAERIADAIVADAPDGDNYGKVVYFNKYIADKTTYDDEALETIKPEYDNTFHMAGVFIDGKAVCEGYAKAFKYLCDKSGIECLYITGGLVMNEAGELGPHAWNYVKLNGKWFIVDTTNNDEPNNNIALCIGTDNWFAKLLKPDGAYDYEKKVFIDTPDVDLNAGDYITSVTFTPPTKTQYFLGDPLDLKDFTVTATRHNGQIDKPDTTLDMISGLDMNKVGEQNATVIYNGKRAATPLKITVNNAPVSATIYEATVNYPLGVSSLDDLTSKGYAMVTYLDKSIARPALSDTTKVTVSLPVDLPIGVSGVYTVTVTILDPNKPITTTYDIGVGLEKPLPELPPEVPESNDDNDHSGGGGGGGDSVSNVPNALPPEKAVSELAKVDPKSPPAGSKTLTIGGKSIITLPMAIPENGLIGLDIINQLGALSANVGVVINQGANVPELFIPGNFKFTPEPGQFGVLLKITNELPAGAKEAVAKALEAAKRTQVYVGNFGGTSTVYKFPVPFTIMVPVKLPEGTAVTVQMVHPVTGKQLSTLTVKVVGGKVIFPTSITGSIVVSTAK